MSIIIDVPHGISFLTQALDESYVMKPELRERMPIHSQSTLEERQAYYQRIKEGFITHINRLDFEELCEPLLKGQYQRNFSIDIFQDSSKPRITLDSKVVMQEGASYRLNETEKVLLFNYKDCTLIYNRIFMMSFKYITSGAEFLVGKLPGMLTNKHRLELVQELVDIGFLTYFGEQTTD